MYKLQVNLFRTGINLHVYTCTNLFNIRCLLYPVLFCYLAIPLVLSSKSSGENDSSSSGTCQLSMTDIQESTKSQYYDHILLVLLYLESRRCRHPLIILVCFYLYAAVVNFID
jgi:hypothetical protein